MSALMIVPAIGFAPVFPELVWRRLQAQGVARERFAPWLLKLDQETTRREREGELDHLIHYALLSRKFTKLPPVEPALSAKAFHETGVIPERLTVFREALRGKGGGERMDEFRKIAAGADLDAEYGRAMRFLYGKEFGGNKSYAARGHSTDTSFTANFAVWNGLQVLKQLHPEFAIRRILIIGPGLDFAPRTGLDEEARPQSYQPFAVLDALPEAQIHCYDINPRVIRFFETFSENPVLEIRPGEGNAAYQAYFAGMGKRIGNVFKGKIEVAPRFRGSVTAELHNLLTGPAQPVYDLVIATNVLLYYEGPELTLAVANIAAHMKPGAFFLHNDLRPALDLDAHAANLEAVAARTVQISATTFDSFALYRRF